MAARFLNNLRWNVALSFYLFEEGEPLRSTWKCTTLCYSLYPWKRSEKHKEENVTFSKTMSIVEENCFCFLITIFKEQAPTFNKTFQ